MKMVENPATALELMKHITDECIEFVDLRFADLQGKEHHFTLNAKTVDEALLLNGKLFDGSSIRGWKGIHASDMLLKPDVNTHFIDPFFEDRTLVINCDVVEPGGQASSKEGSESSYSRDPRSIAKRAEAYLKETGIADTCYMGPEPEFFLFDEVKWSNQMHSVGYQVDSEEGAWNSSADYDDKNTGHRPRVKGGYFPVPPVDSHQDIRSHICKLLEQVGQSVEVHHHEVATAGQCEIGVKFAPLLKKADQLQAFKYIVHNVAHQYGKTATFMPKPLVGDNGNGMHVHQSLFKAGENLFAGDQYANLSQLALFYIGGILKHAKALNALTNPSTNSYKRLVPGFEAPVTLGYGLRNRSAAIRIPFINNDKARRIEVRFPDPTANPYLAFSAMLMAGLDGIQNKIDPGAALEGDLYQNPNQHPSMSVTLQDALDALKTDRQFLLAGDVFTQDLIDAHIALKQSEVDRLNQATHPLEFDMYYSL